MGTVYSVIAVDPSGKLDTAQLESVIATTLAGVNSSMSNWDAASEISSFNRSGSETVPVSSELAEVLSTANEVHEASLGRFDLTLGPLIEIWGFGETETERKVPSDAEIESALALVGQKRVLTLTRNPDTLRKSDPDVSVYLAAIAKGYGIDRVATALRDLGLSDFMVEIGGDLFASGKNPKGKAWRIGIERPDPTDQRVEDVLPLSGLGLATSGDYRNYFEQNGTRYAHIIDPVTGRSIAHRTASVTVLAQDAMRADAWATALLVLGAERGMPLAEKNGLAAFFIVRDEDISLSKFSTLASSRFTEILASEEE